VCDVSRGCVRALVVNAFKRVGTPCRLQALQISFERSLLGLELLLQRGGALGELGAVLGVRREHRELRGQRRVRSGRRLGGGHLRRSFVTWGEEFRSGELKSVSFTV